MQPAPNPANRSPGDHIVQVEHQTGDEHQTGGEQQSGGEQQTGGELNILLSEFKDLSDVAKVEMVRRLWGTKVEVEDVYEIKQLDPYFLELKSVLKGIRPRNPLLNLTLEEVVAMVEFLKKRIMMTYSAVLAERSQVDGVPCKDLIDLCLRIWLLIDPHERDFEDAGTHDQPIWPANLCLKQAIAAEFSRQTPRTDVRRWPYNLNASNLEQISRLEIEWTPNLRQHLVLREAGETILIFHHATILKHLQQLDKSIDLFPTGFLLETRQSLAILLPMHSESSQSWYQKSKKNAESMMPDVLLDDNVHGQSIRIGGRKIETYQHWGERMMIIKEAFDQSEPNSFRQWWADTRNSANRSAFWYAFLGIFLAVFFGLCQTAVGVYQVILVYRPPK